MVIDTWKGAVVFSGSPFRALIWGRLAARNVKNCFWESHNSFEMAKK